MSAYTKQISLLNISFFGISDIDECARGLDDCDTVATCTNTAGSYTCSCIAGYTDSGEGKTGQCQGLKSYNNVIFQSSLRYLVHNDNCIGYNFKNSLHWTTLIGTRYTQQCCRMQLSLY